MCIVPGLRNDARVVPPFVTLCDGKGDVVMLGMRHTGETPVFNPNISTARGYDRGAAWQGRFQKTKYLSVTFRKPLAPQLHDHACDVLSRHDVPPGRSLAGKIPVPPFLKPKILTGAEGASGPKGSENGLTDKM